MIIVNVIIIIIIIIVIIIITTIIIIIIIIITTELSWKHLNLTILRMKIKQLVIYILLGIQRRNIRRVLMEDGSPASDQACDQNQRPTDEHECNQQPCPPEYVLFNALILIFHLSLKTIFCNQVSVYTFNSFLHLLIMYCNYDGKQIIAFII